MRRRIQPWERHSEKHADICHTPHQRTSVAQGRFLGESGRRAEAQTRPTSVPTDRQKGLIDTQQELWQSNRAA